MKKILLFVLPLIFTIKMNGQNTSQELIEIKNELINHAIEVGKEYDINLDFSDDSIKNVEKILSDLHSEYKKTKNDEGLNGLAYMFGFYIMDVIEKNHGKGRIERNHPDFGDNVFPFYWNGGTLFPVAWCQKRIFDGDGDNVEIKYRILILDEKKK
ncbi:hypothetical protein WJN01_15355 [Flavobacteriaceae bacterium SZ-1-7]|uniref:hypothetical protein n=1 Tax=Tamlana sedimenti TaxID=3134126 RepID=UPI0031267EB1